MKPRLILLVVTATLASPGAANAKAAQVIPATGKWNVVHGAKKCTAARPFGTGKNAIVLIIERFGPGDTFRMTFAGERFRYRDEVAAMVQFGPAEAVQEVKFFTGTFADKWPAIFLSTSLRIAPHSRETLKAWEDGEWVAPTPIARAQLEAVQWIRFSRSGWKFELPTGRFGRLFDELDKCSDLLVQSWGFDPAALKTFRSQGVPLANSRAWMRSDDYPPSAVWKGQRAIVHFRLNIDDKGSVTACEIQHSTGGTDFEKAVCRAYTRRAKFSPAIDANGKPAATFYRNAVVFRLP